jgi:hypothetical protein
MVALAQDHWVRIVANQRIKGYDPFTPVATLPEPDWPEKDFATLIELAFEGRIIQTPDHPVIGRLKGER